MRPCSDYRHAGGATRPSGALRRDAVVRAAAAGRGRFAGVPLAFERVRVCRRGGRALAPPTAAAAEPGDRLKVIVHARERVHARRARLHVELVRRLAEGGGAGATTLRGVAGFHGDRERLGALRRDAPIFTATVDTPERVAGWWREEEELTSRAGLVTVERVPA